MPAPQIAETDGEADDEEIGEDVDEIDVEAVDVDEPTEPEADAQQEALVDPVPGDGFGDDFFDGTETLGDDADADDDPFGGADDDWEQEHQDEEESEPHSFEPTINSGMARLAVVGLEDGDEKTKLQNEFREVFDEFQLGHYGNELMHEYVLHGEEDIDPMWGFCGSMVMCLGLVVYMRPDGDKIVEDVTERLNFGERL